MDNKHKYLKINLGYLQNLREIKSSAKIKNAIQNF